MSAHAELLKTLGIEVSPQGTLESRSPIDGGVLARVQEHSPEDVEAVARRAQAAFMDWRTVPAPARGEFVRLLGEELRATKENLARLVTLECGKILAEGLGEVQEMIDICDYAVGLSRQLYGLTIQSERPEHHMRELWHPLGPIGIISAFNFPVAVWSWNAAIALVCGNSIVWKPSEKTPLTALACQKLFERAAEKFKKSGHKIPDHLSQTLMGGRAVGEAMVAHPAFPLISATGSVAMGRAVGESVARRMGRSLLELGGNNAIIVAPSADLDLAARGIVFGAVGTAGQRCTSTRRLIVHEDVYDALIPRLIKVYEQVRIGDPLAEGALMGPLIDEAAYEGMQKALAAAVEQGGTILTGGARVRENSGGAYVQPALVEIKTQTQIVRHETFAPILYIMRYRDFKEAIAVQNGVPQGLSSAIFTNDMREAERFLSATGSDCGIANVNIGTSGAEIGGAFGGEKETGGGRESGSDSWKTYMRRQTQTVNYSDKLPLAQGVKFD
ncbi:MAG: aldehyde dehydrogenase family protein [Alphaproteobacteria bacterium]|nr:aldehyde dehydrogenase family protein [Alphaproteobacteria bacterium]